MDEPQLAAQWARIRGRLQTEVGDVEYRSWLRQMTLVGVDGDEIVIHLTTRFLRDWVRNHYGDRLTALWQQENRQIRRVALRVGGGALQVGLAESLASEQSRVELAGPTPVDGEAGRPDGFGAAENRSFTFDSFVVGKPNEFAYACARRVAAQPACQGFNPLFLYGGVGLGKTHLMHAIAWELSTARPNGRPVSVAYMSAETFMYKFITAIRSQSTMEFKEQLRSVDVLMVDDLQFLIGKDNTQEEFFHTFNALVEAGKQIVVSADKSPSDLSGLEDRLRTRLNCGMVADLHATTYELRISILQAKAAPTGIEVPHKVMELLAHKHHLQCPRAGRRAQPADRACQSVHAAGDDGDGAGGAARCPERARPQGDDRGDPAPRRRALQHPADRYVVGAARAGGGAATANRDVSGEAADEPQPAGDRPQVRQPRSHDGHACLQQGRRADRTRSRLCRGCRTAAPDAGILSYWVRAGAPSDGCSSCTMALRSRRIPPRIAPCSHMSRPATARS